MGFTPVHKPSLGEFPNIVREELGIASDQTVVVGMAMGYADPDAAVNTFQPLREPLSSFVTSWEQPPTQRHSLRRLPYRATSVLQERFGPVVLAGNGGYSQGTLI